MSARSRSTANVYVPRRKAPIDTALRKHSEALASIEVHKRWIVRLEERCRVLAREIEALGGFPKPRRKVIDFRAKGEMQRTMFDMLRERGTITAADLAAAMGKRYGLDMTDPEIAHALRQRCIQCFGRCERKGTVRRVGWSESVNGRKAHGRFVRWGLAAPGESGAKIGAGGSK